MTSALCVSCVLVCSAVLAAGATPVDELPWYNPDLPQAERLSALMAAMTTEEKMTQLVTDFSKAAPAIPRLQVPSYDWRSNMLHGLVDNGVSTVFPQAIGMAATFDPDLIYRAGRVMANEQRAKFNIITQNKTGADVPMDYGLNVWGPNINIFRDPRWGRGQETYGECPFLTGTLATALVGGLQDEGSSSGYPQLLATVKHFVAYDVDREPPRLSFDPNISQTDLRQTFFPAFEAAIRGAHVGSIMCSYNGVNSYPMCLSPMLQSVLRQEFGFDGFLCSDSGAISFAQSFQHFTKTVEEAAALALKAGVDLNSGGAYYQLPQALAHGLISAGDVNRSAARLFKARLELGMFDPPSKVPYSQLGPQDIATPASRQLALEIAERGIVLLKNEGQTLPLASAARRIAVVGPNANVTRILVGNYYGCHEPNGPLLPNCSFVTPLLGIQTAAQAMGASVTYAAGCDVESTNTSGFAQAVANANEADVVVAVMGLVTCIKRAGSPFHDCESEGHDRDDVAFPGVQEELLKALHATGKPVVLVQVNGGPISSAWAAETLPAIVETWYGGETAGTALANVLFGKTAPSGRLPFTVVVNSSQLPDELDMNMTTAPGRTYRYLTEEPLFSFGYGLSYTSFVYEGLSLQPAHAAPTATDVTACVSVRSASPGTHSEVVQAYATYHTGQRIHGHAAVPLKQLVAVVRTEVSPAKKQVCLKINLKDLRLMDEGGKYGVRTGTYTISVGSHAPGSTGRFTPAPAATALLNATLTIA